MDTKNNSKKNDLKSVMVEPFLPELPEALLKYKRNLILISAFIILICIKHYSIETTNQSLLGFKLLGIRSEDVILCLGVVSLYFLVSYTWRFFEFTNKSVIQKTSNFRKPSSAIYVGDDPSGTDHYSTDEEQATLYTWWVQQSRELRDSKNIIQEIKKLREMIKNYESFSDQGNTIFQRITTIEKKINTLGDIVNAKRIKESIENFEKYFWWFLKLQGLRFTILEGVLPISMGGVSIIWVICRAFF